MNESNLEIRQTAHKGRGVFALQPIVKGERVLKFHGRVLKTSELTDDMLAMQVGPNEWLCSDGTLLDDCVNHSCDPNAGFLDGSPVLFALRNIQAGEEITWDYSTSISDAGWTLNCRCGSSKCRDVVKAWVDLEPGERERLRPTVLEYLRQI